MFDLASQRFYGAKSDTIDAITVATARPVAVPGCGTTAQWQLLDVTRGADSDTYQVLLAESASGETQDILSTDSGATAYVAALPELGEVHGDLITGAATPLGAEQSNTNLVVGNTIVKVFRHLEDGLNPDVELLTRIGDCPHVAAVSAYVTRGEQTLAMQQEFIRGGIDGFVLTTGGSAEGTLPEAEVAAHAESLGRAMRTVHEALAHAFGVQERPTRAIADTLTANLDAYVRRAPLLADFAPRIRALYAELGNAESTESTVPMQRVHGDLHLGQTLKTPERWYLIDFEGEPARPLAQRRRPDHRLRDVAGMVRSYGYARAVGGFDVEWERDGVEKLLAGYGAERDALLAAYIVDKAAYEVIYEANNRPDWVDIPLDAIRDLV